MKKRMLCVGFVILLISGVTYLGFSTGAKETAIEEKVLVIAMTADVEDLDPQVGTMPRSEEAMANVYDQLVTYEVEKLPNGLLKSNTLKTSGNIAEKIEIGEDGKTYTFTLRKGIKFHSGNELTTADVQYTWDRGFAIEAPSWGFDLSISTIKKPIKIFNDYSFQFYTEEENPITLQIFQMGGTSILDSKLLKEKATADDPWAVEWMKKNTAASGPWYIDNWKPGVEIVWKANQDYYLTVPYFDKMIWKIIPSVATQILMLKRGEVDVIERLSGKDAGALEGEEGIQVWSFPSQNLCRLMPSNVVSPFNNQKLRAALAYAIPYEEIIESVYAGKARIPRSPIAVGSPAHDESGWIYDTNLEKAKQLVKEAGFEDGFEATLSINVSNAVHQTLAVIVQDALAKIGGKIEIDQLSSSAFNELKYGRKLQLYIDEILAWIDDPWYILNLNSTTTAWENRINYSNPEFDKIVDDAAFVLDVEKRNQMFAKAQAIFVEDIPWIPISQPNYNFAVNEDIEGYVQFFDELVRFNTMRK